MDGKGVAGRYDQPPNPYVPLHEETASFGRSSNINIHVETPCKMTMTTSNSNQKRLFPKSARRERGRCTLHMRTPTCNLRTSCLAGSGGGSSLTAADHFKQMWLPGGYKCCG